MYISCPWDAFMDYWNWLKFQEKYKDISVTCISVEQSTEKWNWLKFHAKQWWTCSLYMSCPWDTPMDWRNKLKFQEKIKTKVSLLVIFLCVFHRILTNSVSPWMRPMDRTCTKNMFVIVLHGILTNSNFPWIAPRKCKWQRCLCIPFLGILTNSNSPWMHPMDRICTGISQSPFIWNFNQFQYPWSNPRKIKGWDISDCFSWNFNQFQYSVYISHGQECDVQVLRTNVLFVAKKWYKRGIVCGCCKQMLFIAISTLCRKKMDYAHLCVGKKRFKTF